LYIRLSSTSARSHRIRGGAHKLLCALIAASTAHAVVHGQVAWLFAALLLLCGTIANARVSSWPVRLSTAGKFHAFVRAREEIGAVCLTAHRPVGVRRRPGFHAFLMRRLGDPLRQPGRFLYNFFVRPLCASSFSEFWRHWNPVYGYLLLFFVYPSLRRCLPRRAALYGSFLFSGFFLHDLPFNLPAGLSRGRLDIPEVTLLFAIYGALTLISEALRVDLSGRPVWLRVAVNLSWLGLGLGLRNFTLGILRAAFMR
jgi:hypothetical protein